MEDFKTAFTRFAIDAIAPTLTSFKKGDFMADVLPIDQLEARLRAELDAAEEALRNATPEEKAEARRQFKDTLHRFSVWVFTGRLERRHA